MALIKINESKGASDFTAYEVKSRTTADLLVCVTESKTLARGRDDVWCYVEADTVANARVCMVESRGAADLAVGFVASNSLAGWKKDHRLQGKIGGKKL